MKFVAVSVDFLATMLEFDGYQLAQRTPAIYTITIIRDSTRPGMKHNFPRLDDYQSEELSIAVLAEVFPWGCS